jgi:hypothetical protein
MAVGFTLRASPWAAVGPVIAPRPAMKEQYRQMRNCENFVISDTLRVVRGYPRNVVPMR